jgi:predicted PurR-regulated permease PerM
LNHAEPQLGNHLTRHSAAHDNTRLLGIFATVVVIATLYFGRIVFIPLALALLFSLVLTPVVAFLERLKLPRVLAISIVMLALVTLMGFVTWETSQQFSRLSDQLPAYEKALEEKIASVKTSGPQGFNKASDALKELEKEISATPAQPGTETKRSPALGSTPARPLSVEVVPPANPLESFVTLLGPLATAGIVLVFTVFILVGREDLRNRFIRLAGNGRLNLMTQALDEAAQRINRYLLLQFMVNSLYGVVIAAALHVVGIPNAVLWGVSAAVLRFLPYVGAPLAALMPIALSIAVFPGWTHGLVTAGIFLVLEITVANLVEPLLYGAHVGLSPLAILVAAVFWTLIWGFPGLLLSTPLTVCLVVMGRYVPSLSFLNVLLGDEPVLEPHALYYQRLLAGDQNEARQVLEGYLKDKTLEELYGSVVIPALGLAEHDRHRGELDEDTQSLIYQGTREIIEELGEPSSGELAQESQEVPSECAETKNGGQNRVDVLCIPARDAADDVVASLLCQLLEGHGVVAQSLPIGTTAEMLSQVATRKPRVVCISALPPFAVKHTRALYGKLRLHSPNMQIIVCLWQFDGDTEKLTNRFKLAKGHGFFTTLSEVLANVDLRAHAIVSSSVE